MASIDIDIGTFNLNSSNNVSVATFVEQVQKSVKESVIPKGDGSVAPIGVRSAIIFQISGAVKGTTYTTLRDNLIALKNAFESSVEQKLTLDNERVIRVQLLGFSSEIIFMQGLARWSCQLLAKDPYWYSETLNSDSNITTAAPSQSITNSGNQKARLKITITAGGNTVIDDFKLVNSTLGITIQYRGTIAAGKDLVINNRVDQDDFTVETDGVNDKVNFEGDLPAMASGSNSWVLTTAIASVTVKIEWRDPYV